LCIPADDTEDSSGKAGASPTPQALLGTIAADLDLSQVHLELCLNLELPLVIVITKYDLATKAGLRQTLSKILSMLKEAGRKPLIVPDVSRSALEPDLHSISPDELQEVSAIARNLSENPLATVPIVLTSALKGTGINKLHAVLRQLPVPCNGPVQAGASPTRLFHVEDVYSVQTRSSSDRSAIIGGYLRSGVLNVGDELLLGPYPVDTSSDDSDSGSGRPQRPSTLPQSRSFPGALKKTHTRNGPLVDHHSEWRRVRITSLRNLRLPVRTLHADQVGTMGIVPVDTPILSPAINRIRKGMVLADRQPNASKVIAVRFEGSQTHAAQTLSIGSAVVVYTASVRASSKVISVTSEPVATKDNDTTDEDAFGFGFDDDPDKVASYDKSAATTVTFQFIASREFIEHGAKVLVMPGGGPGLIGGNERGAKGLAGLEGFVGHVITES
jgi:GTPase